MGKPRASYVTSFSMYFVSFRDRPIQFLRDHCLFFPYSIYHLSCARNIFTHNTFLSSFTSYSLSFHSPYSKFLIVLLPPPFGISLLHSFFVHISLSTSSFLPSFFKFYESYQLITAFFLRINYSFHRE